MIASSRPWKGAALAVALAAHAGIVLAVMSEPAVTMEGAADGTELALGSSFADMAAGRLSASSTPEVAEADPTPFHAPREPMAPVAPETARSATTAGSAAPLAPERASAAAAVIPIAAERPAAQHVAKAAGAPPADTPMAAARLAPAAGAAPTALNVSERAGPPAPAPRAEPPDRTAAALDPATVDRVTPAVPGTRAARPTRADNAPRFVVAAEPLAGTAPESTAVTRSLRPQIRNPDLAAAHRERTAPQPRRDQAAAPAPRGNADRNARAGQASGRDSGTARSTGTGQSSEAAGNAAASNYPGEVMARLSRVRRPNVSARGTALVAFSIAGNGGLAGVSVARSSGSPELDRAAVRLVQSAAPFPPPPSGARRSFSISIAGR